MSKIKSVFDSLDKKQSKALIPFITAGDPDPEMTIEILHTLVDAGADMIELGIPFTDPMADGPVIQRASERAIANNVGIKKTIEIVKEFRQKNKHTPIILMGYANPMEAIGIDLFIQFVSHHKLSTWAAAASASFSSVHRVKLSLSNCMIKVASL